jgi:hypothetical protein
MRPRRPWRFEARDPAKQARSTPSSPPMPMRGAGSRVPRRVADHLDGNGRRRAVRGRACVHRTGDGDLRRGPVRSGGDAAVAAGPSAVAWAGFRRPVHEGDLALVRPARSDHAGRGAADGAKGIVSALHHVPSGIAWSADEVAARKAEIEAAGLTWDVIESIPVSEAIKTRHGAVAGACGGLDRQPARGGGGRRAAGDLLQLHAGAGLDPHGPAASGRGRRHGDAVRPDGFRRVRSSPAAPGRGGGGLSRRSAEKAAIRAAALDAVTSEALAANITAGLPGSMESWTLDDVRACLADYAGWGPTTCAAT